MMAWQKYHGRTLCRHHYRHALFCTFLVFHLLAPLPALADEIILTTGEKFISSKVWQAAGKIRFNMHGLVVSVDKSDVARIITDNGVQHRFTHADSQIIQGAPSITPQKQTATPTPPPQEQQATPPPVSPTPEPTSRQQAPTPQKVEGIGRDGINWFMSPKEITGLELIEKDPAYGGIDQYWRPDDKMHVGQALLDGIIYGFWRNQLYSVMMWAEGRAGYKRLRNAVIRRYGAGRKSSKVPDRYVWADPTTDRMLEFDRERNTGFFWMRSHKLDAMIKKRYPDG